MGVFGVSVHADSIAREHTLLILLRDNISARMKTLKPVDVAIAGGGWTGLLMAKELATRTGLEIVVLERGAARKPSDYTSGMDELDYSVRNKMMHNPALLTVTHRHSMKDRAAPIRQYG